MDEELPGMSRVAAAVPPPVRVDELDPRSVLLHAMHAPHPSLNIGGIKAVVAKSVSASRKRVAKLERTADLARRRQARAERRARMIAERKALRASMITDPLEAERGLRKPKMSRRDRDAAVRLLGLNRCRQCIAIKPVSEFYRTRATALGIHSVCADCKYVRFNKAPRDVFLRHRFTHCKSRAKKKGFEFDLELQDLHALYDKQGGICALSGQPMTFIIRRGKKREFVRHPTNVSLDRIDPTRGYTRDNIQLVTNVCNHSKMDLPQPVFIEMCIQVADIARAAARSAGAHSAL